MSVQTVKLPAGSTLTIRVDGEPQDKIIAAFAEEYDQVASDISHHYFAFLSYSFLFDMSISVDVEVNPSAE